MSDPRNPNPDHMVSCGSTHPFHILKIARTDGDVHFVVEGLAEWPASFDEMTAREKYFYEQHTCPTNFIRIPLIAVNGDTDPHGIFEFVESVWMMSVYDGLNDKASYLCEVFPQLRRIV